MDTSNKGLIVNLGTCTPEMFTLMKERICYKGGIPVEDKIKFEADLSVMQAQIPNAEAIHRRTSQVNLENICGMITSLSLEAGSLTGTFIPSRSLDLTSIEDASFSMRAVKGPKDTVSRIITWDFTPSIQPLEK